MVKRVGWMIHRVKIRVVLLSFMPLLLIQSCQENPPVESRNLNIEQNWALKPGHYVAGHLISGGLGDVSIEVQGSPLFAPFSGLLQPHQTDCAIFSSPEVPAYLLRICGLKQPQLGPCQVGTRIGTGKTVHFAALRKQPTGQWAIVEPASDILERMLSASTSPEFKSSIASP